MDLLQGLVIKAYNGYYYVQTSTNETIMCTVRGRFKKERFTLLVGDEVEFTITNESKGVIEKILPRRTMLKRPMVANIDQVILVFAAASPDVNPVLIDRFLVMAELSGLNAVICINKMDIADSATINSIVELYRGIGYTTVTASGATQEGLNEIQKHLTGKITVFAGPSGVGKSTLINAIIPGLFLDTSEVSEKIGRGRHTTRFAQLLPLPQNGFVVDTPGFSLTEFKDVEEVDVKGCFPEFFQYFSQCRFSSCLHDREPQCAVKLAVEAGRICHERYQSYLQILEDIRSQKKGYL